MSTSKQGIMNTISGASRENFDRDEPLALNHWSDRTMSELLDLAMQSARRK